MIWFLLGFLLGVGDLFLLGLGQDALLVLDLREKPQLVWLELRYHLLLLAEAYFDEFLERFDHVLVETSWLVLGRHEGCEGLLLEPEVVALRFKKPE